MKTLVIYYSRTGTTKKVAEEIAEKLDADIEEIRDTVKRSGIWGWLISGRDGMNRRLTKLHRMDKNPIDYDLVIVGTPIWAGISAPVRTYLTAFKSNFKKVAFFCTMGGSGEKKTFKEMGEIIAKEPVETLTLLTREVTGDDYKEKVENFISSVREK